MEVSAAASTEIDDDGNDGLVAQSTNDIPPGSTQISEEPSTGEWSEVDFPPLGKMKGQIKVMNGVWGEKTPSKQTSPRSCIFTFRNLSDTFEFRSPPLAAPQPASPREESSSFATLERSLEVSFQSRCQVQELEIPSTPRLGMSPITPKTPGSLFPITPTDGTIGFQTSAFKEYEDKESAHHSDSGRIGRELDPTTLFVGGLETSGPGAWDETKVENFFARFGGLESVKVVRPGGCLCLQNHF